MGHGEATGADSGAGIVANTEGSGWREECQDNRGIDAGDRTQGLPTGFVDGGSDSWPSPTNGFWRDVDWLGCRDGKFRPVEPGTFPLVNGASARVVRLRAYGNAINSQAAQAFIGSVMEVA